MNEFAQYQPESWIVDGLLVNKRNMFAKTSTLQKIKKIVKKNGNAIMFSTSILFTSLPVTGLASPSNTELEKFAGSIATTTSAVFSGKESSVGYLSQSPDNATSEVELGQFLSFINNQIEQHPELLVPANKAQLQRINDLLIDL